MRQNSKGAKIFCLVHKMDLVNDEQREQVFRQRESELKAVAAKLDLEITCFKTSIWDETLYRAWSQMVHALIPNRTSLQTHLDKLCQVCNADEVVLFERATFLVICEAVRASHEDVHRCARRRLRHTMPAAPSQLRTPRTPPHPTPSPSSFPARLRSVGTRRFPT